MDNQGKQKSDLGNDKKLNRGKNDVTRVKTTDQPRDQKSENDSRTARKPKQ